MKATASQAKMHATDDSCMKSPRGNGNKKRTVAKAFVEVDSTDFPGRQATYRKLLSIVDDWYYDTAHAFDPKAHQPLEFTPRMVHEST